MARNDTTKVFYNPAGSVRVDIGQHFMIGDRKGFATKLGRKYVEVLIYGGKRVKVDPIQNRPLDTHHH
jgi:hypothetical protein